MARFCCSRVRAWALASPLGGGEPGARRRRPPRRPLRRGRERLRGRGRGRRARRQLLAAGGELGEEGARVPRGLLIDELPARSRRRARTTVISRRMRWRRSRSRLAGAQGLVEGGAALFVGAVALLHEAGEAVDGFAGAVDLLAVGLDDALKLHDLAGKLVDLALAGEAEGAFGVGHDAAGDDAGGVEEDAVERDDGAEAAADHPPGDAHVLDDDDAAEEGIDEVAEAAVAAHEAGGDADDATLLLQVERVDLAEAVEGEELGAAAGAFTEELDGVDGPRPRVRR